MGSVQHLPYSVSNHCPLLVNKESNRSSLRDQRFYFEAWWTLDDSFEGTLTDIWESSSAPLVEKLKIVQIGLKKWARDLKFNKGDKKRRLTKELEILLMDDMDEETLKIHLNIEIDKDEVYWEQRARTNWL
ncbi:putative Transposon TX1 [Gossypium australe]|uniref:Putative Transposon TX1 n=1 Tax=Gossypium australe TaxID=47621 RepID=A0A5B6WZF4_9ROSI|nr:putative Transposon TX1 [Gossypium australe]